MENNNLNNIQQEEVLEAIRQNIENNKKISTEVNQTIHDEVNAEI